MRRDLETTTPEAAATYEANATPHYDERADYYEPDLGPSRQDDDGCEWDDLIHDSALRADRLLRSFTGRRS